MNDLTKSVALRVCVFCGSARGKDPKFADYAARLGRTLAERGATVIYGGASVGLMGVVADAALAAQGQVIGVLPESLRQRELAHTRLTKLHITADLASRKLEMLAMSDAFVALPGGIGTLDELFEIWTLIQLGAPHKPMVLVDQDGYYAGLLEFLGRSVRDGFLSAASFALLGTARTPEDAVAQIFGTVVAN